MQCNQLCCTKINNLTVIAADDDSVILNNINLHLHCGELTSVIGPNGAGKSTLLKAIIGEVKYKGAVEFVSEVAHQKVEPIIGYVPQSLAFDADSPATVNDLFKAAVKDKKAIGDALKTVNAAELTNRKLAHLSGGELQRVLLALALVPLPNLLLLDEPVSGVDKSGIELFWTILSDIRKSYDIAIIIVSHNMTQVKKYSDRVVKLDKGMQCGVWDVKNGEIS